MPDLALRRQARPRGRLALRRGQRGQRVPQRAAPATAGCSTTARTSSASRASTPTWCGRSPSTTRPTRAARSRASRSPPTRTRATGGRCSSRWACTTRVSGRPASTPWSGPTSSILGYRRGDVRAKRLVETTRTIVVPVDQPRRLQRLARGRPALPDGDGADTDADGSGDISDEEFILAAAAHPNEYRRKNCRLPGDPEAGNCSQPSTGLFEGGVDPNRNYGAFWGGPGLEPRLLHPDLPRPGGRSRSPSPRTCASSCRAAR